MPLTRVYLIRHGQTAWNVEGRWQGFESVPLNETGVAQARALAAGWQRPLNAIYSSDLARAWDTAVILGRAAGLEPTPDPRLREFNLGIFQGLTTAEQQARYPDVAAALAADFLGYCVPNGESRGQLQARVHAAWQDITATDPGPAVAIVSHGGAIRMLLYRLFGVTPALQNVRLDNTSVTTVEWQHGNWHLVGVNETPHLADARPDREG